MRALWEEKQLIEAEERIAEEVRRKIQEATEKPKDKAQKWV